MHLLMCSKVTTRLALNLELVTVISSLESTNYNITALYLQLLDLYYVLCSCWVQLQIDGHWNVDHTLTTIH